MHTILDAINTHRIVFLLLKKFNQILADRAYWLPLSLKQKGKLGQFIKFFLSTTSDSKEITTKTRHLLSSHGFDLRFDVPKYSHVKVKVC
jgi:hypothetical protein